MQRPLPDKLQPSAFVSVGDPPPGRRVTWLTVQFIAFTVFRKVPRTLGLWPAAGQYRNDLHLEAVTGAGRLQTLNKLLRSFAERAPCQGELNWIASNHGATNASAAADA